MQADLKFARDVFGNIANGKIYKVSDTKNAAAFGAQLKAVLQAVEDSLAAAGLLPENGAELARALRNNKLNARAAAGLD